ncbi:hypothetical protein CRG98_029955 [Punica granatum]|uniref:Uncharacterized protein n=1 Tax=Punica granatum TaxID=22663 RepID=A0A2I0J076_PUNGR|nr:hypothetical protein CRG98_029955 [Punica granatum]
MQPEPLVNRESKLARDRRRRGRGAIKESDRVCQGSFSGRAQTTALVGSFCADPLWDDDEKRIISSPSRNIRGRQKTYAYYTCPKVVPNLGR